MKTLTTTILLFITTTAVLAESTVDFRLDMGLNDTLLASDSLQIPYLPLVNVVTDKDGNSYQFQRMKDGNFWLTENLRTRVKGSYCYEDNPEHCEKYGRLYTWKAAKNGCKSLGEGWKLPKTKKWRKMAESYGTDDPKDGNQAAYNALIIGGESGFRARLGGSRHLKGSFAGIGIEGIYWTGSAYAQQDPYLGPNVSTLPRFKKTNGFIACFHSGDNRYYQSFYSTSAAYSVRCIKEK